MPVAVLTIAKLILLGLLYIFLIRAVRTMALDLRSDGGERSRPPPRPAVAPATTRRTPRRQPREVVVHAPDRKPRVVALDGEPLTIGRAGRAHVRVDDGYVSDEHAELSPDGDEEGWHVRDLGSTNGTFLNGARVTRRTPFGPGDQIRVGKTRLEVRR